MLIRNSFQKIEDEIKDVNKCFGSIFSKKEICALVHRQAQQSFTKKQISNKIGMRSNTAENEDTLLLEHIMFLYKAINKIYVGGPITHSAASSKKSQSNILVCFNVIVPDHFTFS